MKKIIATFIMFIALMFVSEECYAIESGILEVYGTADLQYDAVYIDVERTMSFNGDIWPNDSIYWEEVINGHTYGGTLYLESFYVKNNITSALYSGQLRKIN